MGAGKDAVLRQMFLGNVLLVGCFAFYLLWWILAFKPRSPVTGMRSGWLLIPAAVLGIIAVVEIIRAGNAAPRENALFSGKAVLLLSLVFYIALFLISRYVFQRMVTTELLLIVGWAGLVFWEINALFSLGSVSRGFAVGMLAAAVIAAVISLVCYMLYYGLGPKTGYIDGMVPLVIAGVFMAVLAVFCKISPA